MEQGGRQMIQYLVSCLTAGYRSLQTFPSEEQALRHIASIKRKCPNAEILTQKIITENWEYDS